MPASLIRGFIATASVATALAMPAPAVALPSDLVSAFGVNGIAAFDPRPGTERGDVEPVAIKVLADGKTIVVGRDRNSHLFVARLLASGGLDATFGAAGLATVVARVDDYHDIGDLDVDSAGRILIAGRIDGDAFIARLTANGQLDATFDGDGVMTLTAPSGYGGLTGIAAEGTNFYVLRGGYPARVYRYTAAGALDPAFGAAGVSTGPTNMNDTKLALDASGRLVVAGSITGSGYRVYRLQGMADAAPGFFDGTFAPGGLDLTSGGGYSGTFKDLVVDGTDTVHLLGTRAPEGFQLVRVSTTGVVSAAVDSAAGPGGADTPVAIAALGGSLIVAGRSASGGFLEMRATTNGSPVGTFNGGAALTFTCTSGPSCPLGAVDFTTGQISYTTSEQNKLVRVGKVTPAGGPFSAFSGDGLDTFEQRFPWGNQVNDSFQAPDGALYILGEAGEYGNESTYIAKQLANGTLDPSFGAGGVIVIDLRPASPEYVSSVVVDASGRVYVAGGYGGTAADLWRFTSTGLDASFGVGGRVGVTFPGATAVGASAMVLDGSSLVVGGYDVQGANFKVWVHRLAAATGAPDPQFNGGTARVVDLDGGGGASEYLNALQIAPGGSVLVSGASDNRVRVIKLTAAGALDGGFGAGGISALNALGAVEPGAPVLVDLLGDGRLLLATGLSDVSGSMLLFARLSAGGALDPSYGTGGSRTMLAGDATPDVPYGLVVDGQGRATVGGFSRSGSGRDTLLARVTADGAVDETFSPGGFVRRDLSQRSAPDSIGQLHLRGTELIGVGGRDSDGSVRQVFVAAFGEPRPPASGGTPPPPVVNPVARKATSKITRPKGKQPLRRALLRTIRGTAAATGGTLKSVQLSIRRVEPKRCAWVTNTRVTIKRSKTVQGRCTKPVWLRTSGTTRWSLTLRKALPAGRYEIRSRAILTDGTAEATTASKGANVFVVRVK